MKIIYIYAKNQKEKPGLAWFVFVLIGAGNGNRTHINSLEGYSSAIELYPRQMVLKEGLEPSRYCYHRILSPVRLPFRHFSINGAPPETRTPDPFIKSEMLYH